MVVGGRVPPRNWVEVLLNFLRGTFWGGVSVDTDTPMFAPMFAITFCVGEWFSSVVMSDVLGDVVETVGPVGCVGFTDVLWAKAEVMGVVVTGTGSAGLEEIMRFSARCRVFGARSEDTSF